MKRYFYYVAQGIRNNFNPSINLPKIPVTLCGMVEWETLFNPILLAKEIGKKENLEDVIVTFLYELSEEVYKS
jgi:hypothetical protein|nr:MAG TPA: hypothetical protein [Caudoviricetes sp.]